MGGQAARKQSRARAPAPIAGGAKAQGKQGRRPDIVAGKAAAISEVKVPAAAPEPQLRDNHDFISDFARFAEGLQPEAALRKKWRLTEDVWDRLGEDDALVEAIEDEKIRRVRNGRAKRERAQQHVVKAPDILNGIMMDAGANARHRIDAAKGLDSLAANPADTAPGSSADRFIISINLGDDHPVLHFDKARSAGTDADPDVIEHDSVPRSLVSASASTKRTSGGGDGEPL